MRIKISCFIVLLFFLSCKKANKKNFADNLKVNNYKAQINKVKAFAEDNNYNKKIAFLIDYSLHSGKNRFFVVDLQKEKITKKGLVCHGSCKNDENNKAAKKFSNTEGSLCTSLGMAVMGERAYSKWGKNYKYLIDGLEEQNSNMRKRVVVLHAWEHVPDEEVYPNQIALSWGCPTVSIKFLDELDIILKENKKVLLYSFN